jgi:ankyrin repeat protein
LDITEKHTNMLTAESRLRQAARAGDVKLCAELIEQGADVNHVEWQKYDGVYTSLQCAADRCHVRVCKLLIDAGADPDYVGLAGKSALSLAIKHQHVELCQIIIAVAKKLDSADFAGKTALMWLASRGEVAACEQMIKAGASIGVVDHEGWCAYSLAIWDGHLGVCKLLQEHGADPTRVLPIKVPPYENLRPFHLAVMAGARAIIEYFIDEMGEDPDQRTLAGASMFELAGNASVKATLHSAKTFGYIGGSVDRAATAQDPAVAVRQKGPSSSLM